MRNRAERSDAPLKALTDTDLDSLEKLLSGASPAPWDAIDQGGFFNTGAIRRDRLDLIGRMDHLADAALCAALRNLAPALLEEIRASRAWRKEAEGLLRFMLSEESGFACPTSTEERVRAFLGEREGTEGK